jgi:hypothetical protein
LETHVAKATSYRIRLASLKPFDLIFTNSNRPLSVAVRWADSVTHFTRSRFSHVQLHVGAGFVLEARYRRGVRLLDVSRLLVREPSRMSIRRPIDFDRRCRPEVASALRNTQVLSFLFVGQSYDPVGAVLAALDRAASNEKYICSELAAVVLALTGFNVWDLVNFLRFPFSWRKMFAGFTWSLSNPGQIMTENEAKRIATQMNREILARNAGNITPSMLWHSHAFETLSSNSTLVPLGAVAHSFLAEDLEDQPLAALSKRLSKLDPALEKEAPDIDSINAGFASFRAVAQQFARDERARIAELGRIANAAAAARRQGDDMLASEVEDFGKDLLSAREKEVRAEARNPSIETSDATLDTWIVDLYREAQEIAEQEIDAYRSMASPNTKGKRPDS